MTDRPRTTDEDHTHTDRTDDFGRREFVAIGAGASVTMLAGCAGDGSPVSSDGSGDTDGSSGDALTGSFRLLISDAPADIGDFDSLEVTLDEARVFEAEDGDDSDDEETDDDESGSGGNETETDDEALNGTAEDEEDDDEAVESEDEDDENDDDDGDDEDDEDERAFTVVDLDGATVDLTQVIEEDAIAVFDGEVPAGSYEKIELAVSDVQGIVDGGEVDVKLPSEKLQITNEFEVTPDGSVSFVFDINVVKRGPNGYILKPVISGSGVAGRDVEVNEIDDDEDEDEAESDESADEDDESDDGGNETDDGGNETDDDAAGNETAGSGNETAGDGS